MNKEPGKLIITNNEGKQLECDVLFTFDSDETGKSYIAYTDNTKDENGNIRVYASIYDPNGEDLELKPLTDPKEWKVIESILSSIQEKVDEAIKNSNGESSEEE
jgi:uncharacterized protein YrzB (UPF0473 family)